MRPGGRVVAPIQGVPMRLTLRALSKKVTLISTAFVLAFASLITGTSVFFAQRAYAVAGAVQISSVSQLRDAIRNQANGQTWEIQAGSYGLAAFEDITVESQTGWYFPVTADNLTILGIGNPIIYGTGFTANGNWSTQNLVSVFGDNVTIDGLTLMPKVEPNKTIEVLGSNFTLRNTTFTPNTLTNQAEYDGVSDPLDPAWTQDSKQWGGSLYFSHAGNHTVQNVTIRNAGISFRYSPAGTHITFDNVNLIYETSVDWLNGYRYSSGFDAVGNTITGTPKVTYRLNAALDNVNTVVNNIQDGDTVVLATDLPLAKQLTLTKAVTFDGTGHALLPNFAKTDNDNNAALGIQSNNVTVNNLTVDGTGGTNLHGINVWQSTGVTLNNVTTKNNDRTGLGVNGSTVTVNTITTENNGWHGINVDKPGAVLTVNGTSMHTDAVPIYVDDATVGQVVDTQSQYGSKDNVAHAGDRVYGLKPTVPTAQLFNASGTAVTSGSITSQDFKFQLSSSTDVTRYQLKYWNTIPTSPYNAGNAWSPTDLSASGHMNVLGIYTDNFTQGEGTHYFAFSACNALGICSDFSVPFAVTYDTTAPAVPSNLSWVDSNNNGAQNGSTNMQKGTLAWVNTTPTDVDHYVYKFWTNIPGYFEGQGNAWTTSESQYITTTSTGGSIWTDFADKEGTYYFCIEAVDRAGNNSACSDTLAITYDKTAPVTPIHLSPTNNVSQSSNTFWFDWEDVAGAVSYEVQFSQSGSVDAQGSLNVGVWAGDASHNQPTESRAWSAGANGSWYWQVRAVDAVGNKSAWSTPWKVTIDMEAPVLAINPTTAGTDTTPTISGTSEPGSIVTLSLDNGVAVVVTSDANGNWAWTPSTGLTVGTHDVRVAATDAAGNATVSTQSFAISSPQTTTTTTAITTTTAAGVATITTTTDTTGTIDTTGTLGTQDAQTTTDISSVATDDEDNNQVAAAGATDTNDEQQAANGLFSIAWYWWLVIAAAVAGIWWLVIAARRRNEQN